MCATVGIFAFIDSWNDFMMPSLIISDPDLQTVPVLQNMFQTQFSNNYNVAFASYLMAMAPAVIVYLFAQRWVMSGLTQGAVKWSSRSRAATVGPAPPVPIPPQHTRSVYAPGGPSTVTTPWIPFPPPTDDTDWWRQASVYQIYPRSFADGNGDGIGDLRGIISRVPYLQNLGIDAVWLSPFYPSALADGGYDVDDYRDVDPKIGTLEEFDEMVAALHGVGIQLIVDVVPNHSSDRHEWFRRGTGLPEGFQRSGAVHLPRRRGREWRAAPSGLDLDLRRPGVDACPRRSVVPAQLRHRAAGLQLEAPRGA